MHNSATIGADNGQDRFFRTDHLTKNLSRRSVRGAASTSLGQGAQFSIQIVGAGILARLLTPEDFGLVAMTAIATGLLTVFKDAGLASATIQRAEINHEQTSNLFWVNVTAGFLLALVLVVAAPLLAAMFGDPRVTTITRCLAVPFVIGGFTVQHQALLRRQMRFKTLATRNVVAVAVGMACGIAMAASGMGYWSLVGITVGMAITNMITTWLAVPWMPGLPRRGVGTMPLLKFGGDILAVASLNYLIKQTDSLLIGMHWGPVALGFYNKAYSLLLAPLTQIHRPLAAVTVPALARLNAIPETFKSYYLNALEIVGSMTIPVTLAIAVFADQIVWLWLGPNWLECARLFQLLSLAALFRVLLQPIGWLLISSGKTRLSRLIAFASSAVILAAFFAGISYGAAGVATAYSISMLLLFVPTLYFALRNSPVSVRHFLTTLAPPFGAGMSAAMAGWSVLRFVSGAHSEWITAAIGFLAFVGTYSFVLLVVCGRAHRLAELYRTFWNRIPEESPPTSGEDFINRG